MIESHLHDDVLEIVIGNPPVNALGEVVRNGLASAIAEGQSKKSVKAIVIRGDGTLFSGGADISEFGKPPAHPYLPEVVDAIEASAKPVVAAIHGMALGGGLEVALGCHYRIAAPNAKLGMPEVLLGLLPGAGGTQRLPRLVGAEAALRMIVLGAPISAAEGLELGLIDEIVDEADLISRAIAFARSVDESRRTGELGVSATPEAFDKFVTKNARVMKGLDAPKSCVEAVKAAVDLPFREGLARERALFAALMEGAQSKALRHVFFAERAAAKIDGLPSDIALRKIKRVGVIGAGTMGGGIAMNALSIGIPVTIVETTQEPLDRGIGLVRKNYEASAAKGRLTGEQVETAMGLLTPTLDFDALKDCDLIIEAVYENMDVKKDIFARLDAIAKPGAILASNTSFLSIDEIAAATGRPQDVLGLHFFSPANVMKLVEVVRGAKTADDVLATGIAFARKIGKVPVVAGVCHGFIGNRMLARRQDEANKLLLEGATPQQVDKVHVEFGMPMGPFQMADLAGVDIGWHRDPDRIESIGDALCAQKRWGQKTNAGFYDYDDRRTPSPSPVTEAIIDEFRRKAGVVPREISEEEIVIRTLYVMVNEGAHILDEAIAQRAADVDVVWTHGYGWPRHKGGPMFWGNEVGLARIVDSLAAHKGALGEEFTLSPLLARCAAENRPLDR